jgi:glycine/D-amino acid oxidase-like deaminating enzyme
MLFFNELSFWERKEYLNEIDFAIIGAGIVGMSTAIFLKKRFPLAKITILERGYLPTGASTKNAGFACFGSPTELFDDLQKIKEEQVWETFLLRYQGLQTLFSLVDKEKINYKPCASWDLISKDQTDISIDFIDYLNEKTKSILKQEAVYSDDSKAIVSFGFEGFQKAYKNRLEGSIDTGKLITELYKKTIEFGIQTLFGINLESYTEAINEVNLITNFGELACAHLLVCTNGFANEFLKADLQPARAQVMITKPIQDLKFEGTFHFDAGYYYFRNIENRILIGGGRNLNIEGETTENFGTTDQIQSSIFNLLKENILPTTAFEIDYSWSGIMGVGKEKSPIIKKVNNRVAFGVRMGGMGLAIGSEVGKKLANIF